MLKKKALYIPYHFPPVSNWKIFINFLSYASSYCLENEYESIITASHAIYVSEGSNSAAAAVVGFQFQLTALYKLFMNITSNVRNFLFDS